jgi:serine/threonine-protein kinase
LFFQSAADELSPAFSPDGRWIAYVSSESGPFQVYVRPWPDSGRRWQISSGGGFSPVFARRGSELFFVNEEGQIMAARYRVVGERFVAERARVWSDKRISGFRSIHWSFDVMPDGGGIVALMSPEAPRQEHGQNQLIVLLNFFDHLRRIAPLK